MRDIDGFVKFVLGWEPDYLYCSTKAPCFNIPEHAIVVEQILRLILKEG